MSIPMYQRWYHWQEKPYLLNTKATWAKYGYAPRKNAPSLSEVKTGYRKRKYPLYHAQDCVPIKSKAAEARRFVMMLTHFRSQMDKTLIETLVHRPAMTIDELHLVASDLIDNGEAHLPESEYPISLLIRPSACYFGYPYWDNEQHLSAHNQARLRNSTLDFVYGAIESGTYHQQAQQRREEQAAKERGDQIRETLTRLVTATVPLHPLDANFDRTGFNRYFEEQRTRIIERYASGAKYMLHVDEFLHEHPPF